MENLTRREIEVVYQLLLGRDNKAISRNLEISDHTTKAHLASVYKKLGVANRLQATIKCYLIYTKHKLEFNELEQLLNQTDKF